ncbi:glycosyltransferase family 2 protein [Roseovarius sp.]|jgi:glycosyltransferase involved in cell wall biosynthesis|uniref:glycosyltransferase n=1 Tax=Roseovarius sp. TaxID=1486281 RepID=UPI00257E028A|nr:glycosyltransferase family 2 protein [Roseovarius sp.]
MKQTPQGKISVVTVTYADRLSLLERVVESCLSIPAIADVHVVSNNSKSDLGLLTERWGDRVRIMTSPENRGSAFGFGLGIQSALEGGKPYILLLDDDNVPTADNIEKLLVELVQLAPDQGSTSINAVVATRTFQHQLQMQGFNAEYVYPRPGSFIGFNLFHRLQRRLMRKLGAHKVPPGTTAMTVPTGPYGGFLAAREAYAAIGIPDETLCLYSDDAEYTWRITRNGGALRLVLDAVIDDIDERQSEKIDEPTVFLSLLRSPSTFRLYYSVRNRVWFECYRRPGNRLIYWLNRMVFMVFMRRTAQRIGWPENYAVFLSAVRDGEAGALGIHKDYPLPK